mmetsp:Transcript_36820/g.92539  ORF Transcript_36820/g.92539 Transcript_36820/m.92539 type:complete len:91 (+) Transcript_36820:319-591(+)
MISEFRKVCVNIPDLVLTGGYKAMDFIDRVKSLADKIREEIVSQWKMISSEKNISDIILEMSGSKIVTNIQAHDQKLKHVKNITRYFYKV